MCCANDENIEIGPRSQRVSVNTEELANPMGRGVARCGDGARRSRRGQGEERVCPSRRAESTRWVLVMSNHHMPVYDGNVAA